MKFADFYKTGKPRFSFEIFPPKTPEGIENLFMHLRELKAFDPAFISTTYGAMGTTQALTSDLTLKIQNELKIPAAFHFTCVGSNKTQIKNYVESLKQKGVNLVVALRGDPPAGMKEFVKPADGFSYANELVGYLKTLDGLSLAVAGYPEGHIEAPNLETDLINLKRKVDAGADVILTQLFFDNKDFYNFCERAKKIGITIPIIPGLMPVLSAKQIQKITSMCGAKIPAALKSQLLKYENDDEAVKEIGIEHALLQAKDLLKNGLPGIHFYILNKSYSTKKILGQL